jgi:4-aminobutyrate aminotransferase-like enzyme
MTDGAKVEGWEARRRVLQDAVARHVLRYDSDFLPFFIERAEGAYLFDDSGRRLLDFTSGQMCATLGHNHPALERGSRTVMHLFSRMLAPPVVDGISPARGSIWRLAPPLTVSAAEIDEGLTILDQAIRESLDGAA